MISLGEWPVAGDGGEWLDKLEIRNFKCWLASTLQQHRQELNDNIKDQLAFLQVSLSESVIGTDTFRGTASPALGNCDCPQAENSRLVLTPRDDAREPPTVAQQNAGTMSPSVEPLYSSDQPIHGNSRKTVSSSIKDVCSHSLATMKDNIRKAVDDVHKLTDEQDRKSCCPKWRWPKHSTTKEFRSSDDGESSLETKSTKYWEEYHQHIDDTFMGSLVSNKYFDLAAAAAIMASSIVIFAELEYQEHKGRISLGRRQDGSSDWEHADIVFDVLEHVFNAFFLLELFARAFYLRSKILKDGFAIFDVIIVSVTSVHLYILLPLRVSGLANPTMFRMLRITRLVRILRLVRVTHFFDKLRVLVATCYSCGMALMWSMIFLFTLMFTSAFFLSQTLQGFIQNTDNDYGTREWAFRYYGSGLKSLYTFTEITFAGCWPMYFRPLVEKVNGWYCVFVITYIVLVVFALLRIITALFLKETLEAAAGDSKEMVLTEARRTEKYVEKLSKVFRTVDVSKDGTITLDEFQHVVTHPKVKAWLQSLELATHDVELIFNLIDDGDGSVTYEEFVQGICRLKGQAREIDIVVVLHHVDKMRKSLSELLGIVGTMQPCRQDAKEFV